MRLLDTIRSGSRPAVRAAAMEGDDLALLGPRSELARPQRARDNDAALFCVDRSHGDMVTRWRAADGGAADGVPLPATSWLPMEDDGGWDDDDDVVCEEDVATDAARCTYVSRFRGELGRDASEEEEEEEEEEGEDEVLPLPLVSELYRDAESGAGAGAGVGADYDDSFMREFLDHRHATDRSYDRTGDPPHPNPIQPSTCHDRPRQRQN